MTSSRRESACVFVGMLSICVCSLAAEAATPSVDASPLTTLSGVLEAIVVDDFAQGTAEMQYYLRGDDGTSRRIRFPTALRLRPGARFTVTGQAVGGEVFVNAHEEIPPPASMAAEPAPEDDYEVGEQGTLVLLFNFQDTPNSQPATVAQVEDMVFNAANPASVNYMLREISYAKTWLAGDVLGWQTLPVIAADCNFTYIGTQVGFRNSVDLVDSQVDFRLYKRIIILYAGDDCHAGGAGSYGEWSMQTDEGVVELSMTVMPLSLGITSITTRGALHELGHNFKVDHQDDLECGEAVVGDYADGCDSIDRGNRFDHMANSTRGHDNASTKHRLGWFDPQNIAELGAGTYQISLDPLELPSDQVQTVRIPAVYDLAEGNQSAYYVTEYRQAIGMDSNFWELADPEAGVLILLEEEEVLTGPVLLDVNPHSTTELLSQLDDSEDAYLSLGEAFFDTRYGISITFAGVAAGAAVLTIDVPRVCGDGTCHSGEDSCNCPSDCGTPDPADCTLNGIPDECEPDCNSNGVADICEIAAGATDDCPGDTGNGIPDECDPQMDCNGNGVIDSCDIAGDSRGDLNANGIPDDCESHDMVYVDMENCPGPGSGTSEDPFCNIQDAIDAQEPGAGQNGVVEIVVIDGIYTGERNKNLDFAGRHITVRSINGPENCIIDMEGVGRGFNFHSGESAGARVEGLTIRNGLFGAGFGSRGGGIYCHESSPTIVDCTITDNSAEYKGGGIYAESRSNLSIRSCRITDNSASASGLSQRFGGGIYCQGSSPTISGCDISNNEALGLFGTAGGGIALSRRSDPTIEACTISNNTAYGPGGGIYCEYNSSPTIRGCLIASNRASTNPGNGIAVNGGGLYTIGSTPTIDRCTISNNTAWGGGGISILRPPGGRVVIRNCLITSNHASSSGGVRFGTGLGGTATIENCTITDNFGSGNGAGIFVHQSTLEVGMDVTNSILRGNGNGSDTSESVQIDGLDEILAVNYSNIQGLTGSLGGVGNIDDDPLFVSGTDLRLTKCSPCIDAGDSSAVTGSNDLDGNARITNGVVDMGAYEAFEPLGLFCQPGTFSVTGEVPCEEPCQLCPAGTFQYAAGATACSPCNPGRFQPATGSSFCGPCPAGSVQPESGGTECFACDPGTFSPTLGQEECSPCPAGSAQPQIGGTACIACDPGSIAPTLGLAACSLCAAGTFAATTEMTSCSSCPEGTFQSIVGSSECIACDCDDSDTSTIDSCDAATGSCRHQEIAIPAASTWSLICLALLLMSAGTVLMPRGLEGVH